jgi:microcystin-dependent protein
MGSTGGTESHTLTIAQMPSHNHGGSTSTISQAEKVSHSHSISYNNSANGAGMAQESGQGIVDGTYSTSTVDINHTHTISREGGGQAHNIMHPFLAVTFIIKT